jgi:type II secretory pathway pseudopilin PulG
MFNKKGQMLVEVLVAMGVASIILAAVVNLYIDIQKGGLLNNQRTRANNLVQEGLEAARSVRFDGWIAISTNGIYHPVINNSNGKWELQAGQDTGIDGLFNRAIIISTVYRIANPSDPSFMHIVPAGTPGAVEDQSTKQITTTVSWETPSHQEITQKTYLTRYLNNNLITQTTQTDFNAGTKDNVQIVPMPPPPADNGSVILATGIGPTSYYGNQFLLQSTDGIGRINASYKKCSIRFTAQSSKTVNRVGIYAHEIGTIIFAPTFRIGLQADSGGHPSGTWLGLTNHGYGDHTPILTGWHNPNLNESVNLIAGQVYHLVVQYQSGSISPSRYINTRRSSPPNLIYPYNNNEPNAKTLFYDGISWSQQNYQPIYLLRFTDGTYEGNSYSGRDEYSIYGWNYVGEFFTVTSGDKNITDIGFYVRKSNPSNPPDDLYVALEDLSGGGLIEQGTLALKTVVSPTYSWQTYHFSVPRTLQNGRTYRIYLRSPGSNSGRSYLVLRPNNSNSAQYNSVNYDGTGSKMCSSSTAGAIWLDASNVDIGGYRFTVTSGSSGYVPSGIFTSSVIDAGGQVAFNTIDFESVRPIGTTINLQIATSNNPSGPWNFVGPDGLPSSYYTAVSNKEIYLNNILGRYFVYRANLSTINTSLTPSLDTVYINYSP